MEQLLQLAPPAVQRRSPWPGYRGFGSSGRSPAEQPFAPAQPGCRALPKHHGRFLLWGQNNTESGLEEFRFGFPRIFNSGFQDCKHAVINSLEALTISPMA